MLNMVYISYQLTAAGFLSEQKLPLKLKTSMSGKYPPITLRDFSVPYTKIKYYINLI